MDFPLSERFYGLDDLLVDLFPYVATISLTFIAGICSGMTIGLMGIDEISLRLKLDVGTIKEKKEAQRILPLLKDHHLLLVTLLVTNALASETMPIIISSFLGEVPAVVISVFLTFMFSELVPQALCVGAYQVALTSFFAPFIRVLIILFWGVSYPIARVLDLAIGKKEAKLYSCEQLKVLFSLLAVKNSQKLIDRRQVAVICNGIDIGVCGVEKILVNRVFYLDSEAMIDNELLQEVYEQGFSSIPVKNEEKIVGVVRLKDFLLTDNKVVSEMRMRKVWFLDRETSILQALCFFLQSGCKIALVTDAKGVQGLVSMKDVFRYVIRTDSLAQGKVFPQTLGRRGEKENFLMWAIRRISKKHSFPHPEEFQLVRTSNDESDNMIE